MFYVMFKNSHTTKKEEAKLLIGQKMITRYNSLNFRFYCLIAAVKQRAITI